MSLMDEMPCQVECGQHQQPQKMCGWSSTVHYQAEWFRLDDPLLVKKVLCGLTTLRQKGSVWIDHSKAGRVCGLTTLRQDGSVD